MLQCHYTHNVYYFELQISHGAWRSNRLASLVAIALTYNENTKKSQWMNETTIEAS